MLDTLPQVVETGRVRRLHSKDIMQDFNLLRTGQMNLRSLAWGYLPMRIGPWSQNRVEAIVRGPCRHSHEHLKDDPDFQRVGCQRPDGIIRRVIRTHNLRTTQGRDNWQRGAMFGDITANATGFTHVTGTLTSAGTATTATDTGAAYPTSGGLNGSLQGHIVYFSVTPTFGIIMSNTATVLTVDQWYSPTSSTAAAGSTPANSAAYLIAPTMGYALWIGLSTDSTTPAAADVFRSADGLFGNGGSASTATEQTTNGLARAFVQPTFPSAGNIQLQHTWTYTGSTSVTIAKVVLGNALAAAGDLLFLDTLLNATATVAANGDSIQVTWTISL